MTPMETVNEFMRRVCAKDLDGACEMVSADIEYDNVPMGKNHGPDEMKAFLTPMVAGLDAEFIVHRETTTGNTVMNERTDRFVFGDKQHDLPVMGVFEIDDQGKIRLWRDYFDMAPVNALMADLAG